MPWQMVPPFIIIAGAFTVSSMLVQGVDLLFLGRNKRVMIDEFEYRMDRREEKIADARYAVATEEERKRLPKIVRMYRF